MFRYLSLMFKNSLRNRRRIRRADSRMNYGEPPASIVQLVNRIVARLALAVMNLTRLRASMRDFPDHFLEEAENTMLGDIDRLDYATRFDDCGAHRVALEQRHV